MTADKLLAEVRKHNIFGYEHLLGGKLSGCPDRYAGAYGICLVMWATINERNIREAGDFMVKTRA